jgi:hypothetical protein
MKFNIKINGKSLTKEIPNAWHLLSWGNFLKIAECGEDQTKIISALTDIDVETLKTASIKNYDVLLSCLNFLGKEMNLILPATCNGLRVPNNIEEEAAARYGDIQEIIQKFDPVDRIANLKHYSLIAATYLVQSPYDYKNAEKLSEELNNAPCQEVMAIANFTLARLAASRNGMLNHSHLEGTLRNRLKRAILRWLTRLAFSIRYGIWKRSLHSTVKKYLSGA